MDTVLGAIILITLMVFSASTMVGSAIECQEMVAESWQEARAGAIHQDATGINILSASASADEIEVILENTGSTGLANFDHWDVILSAYSAVDGYTVSWLPCDEPSAVEPRWENAGIYMDAVSRSAEVFNCQVFDPGEQLLIRISLSGPLKVGKPMMIDVIADTGAQACAVFTNE